MDELQKQLNRFSRRYKFLDGIGCAQRTLWMALLLCLIIQLIGRLLPINSLWVWTIIPIISWLILILLVIFARRVSSDKIALRVDKDLDLKERLSTASFLQEQSSPFPRYLVFVQHQDALAVAKVIQPAHDLPFLWRKQSLILALVILTATVTLVVTPNPMDQILAQRAVIAQATKNEADQIEKLRQDIEYDEEIDIEEREELLRKLSELAENLKSNSGDLENALADISNFEREFREKQKPNTTLRKSNLDVLEAQLSSLANLNQEKNKNQMQNIEDALSKLNANMESTDWMERQEIASQLTQLATQASRSGDHELGQALSSFAQSFSANEQEPNSNASDTINQALKNIQTDLNIQEAIQKTLAQLEASSQALSQTGQQIAQSLNQNADAGNSSTPGLSPGAGQGQNMPGGGGGTKLDKLPPANSQGKAITPKGEAPYAKVGELDAKVYAPWQPLSGNGEKISIPGRDTDQGSTVVTEDKTPLPGTANPALVPYNQVYYSYLTAANQAIQTSDIPVGLLDFVRQYFSQLEP